MPIMDYDKWISETKRGIFTPRSQKLVDLDTALQTYSGEPTLDHLRELKTALDDWITYKGPDWKKSTRNKNGTVERLQNEVDAELAALTGPTLIKNYQLVGIPNKLDQTMAVQAMDNIKEAITRAQMAASWAAHHPDQKARLERWFGVGAKANDIKGVYDKILKGIAKGARLIRDDSMDDVFAYVLLSDPKNPPRIYLCGAFWKNTRVEWKKGAGGFFKKDKLKCNDNPLGVVVHELSHLFAATEDHAYGRTKCTHLALTDADKARHNADSFEYYCEDIMLGK